MTHFHPQDELRPDDTVASRAVSPRLSDAPDPVPLWRLRERDRRVIPPERCLLGPDCLVCRWRREGRLARLRRRGSTADRRASTTDRRGSTAPR